MEYKYLDTDKKLISYLQSLRERRITMVSVDIEGEFNLHNYGEHLCLVQIFDQDDFILIDPKTVDINLIKGFFEDSKILKIMYDCSGDRTILFRKYGIVVNSILDLAPAVELLGFQKKGLGAVLQHVLKLEEKPKKKFQKYNWMRRPIDKDALLYAIDDVKYLFRLKGELMNEVIRKGLLDDYIHRNIEVQTRPISLEFTPGVFKKDRFRKMKSHNKKLFKELFERRDYYAEQMDLPPNSVVSNENLFSLSLLQAKVGEVVFSRKMSGKNVIKIREEFERILK